MNREMSEPYDLLITSILRFLLAALPFAFSAGGIGAVPFGAGWWGGAVLAGGIVAILQPLAMAIAGLALLEAGCPVREEIIVCSTEPN